LSHFGAGPSDAKTVPVRVQVIDLEPFALDIVIPTYTSAADLTQRIARDAGLGAYWDDGTRRNYFLRARGRLLGEDERLEDLGIVPHELLHLLPQPPEGSAVEERKPDYPITQGYSAAGWLNVVGGLLTLLAWTTAWALALSVRPTMITGILPSIGLALLATSFTRHVWGGAGSSIRIPLTAIPIYGALAIIAALPALFVGAAPIEIAIAVGPALVVGLIGVMMGWLAWYGAVEPLPKPTVQQVATEQEAVATYPCGICGGPVTPDVRADCKFNCGQVFHVGCYSARQALADIEGCAVCGYRPA
jgi:hypothetical protein